MSPIEPMLTPIEPKYTKREQISINEAATQGLPFLSLEARQLQKLIMLEFARPSTLGVVRSQTSIL